MAIARKKPEEQKTPKSPTKVAKDTGLSSVKRKETLYKDGKEVSREEFIAWDPAAAEILEKVDAIRSAKPPTKKSIQDAAKAEKAKAKEGKPGKLEKFIMAAVPETEEIFMGAAEAEDTIETTEKIVPGKKATKSSKDSKTAKNKSKDSQNGGKDTIVKNEKNSQWGKQPPSEREKRTAEAFLTCQGYAESLVKKSRYMKTDPKKLAYAAFLAIPDCQSITQWQFAESFGVHINTTTNWKFDSKVIKARNEIMMKHFQWFTPAILDALVKGAQKSSWNTGLGDAAMIKLYLQYVEQWNEKQEIDHTSDGKAITWGIAPSQFVRKENVPDPEAEEEEEDDDDSDD